MAKSKIDISDILNEFSDIETNRIIVERASLSDREAELAIRLRKEGLKAHVIAAMLGTNPGRTGELFGSIGFPRAK